MRRSIRANSPLLAVIWLALPYHPAEAQMPISQGQVGIQIMYKEPNNPVHRPIYERLKKRQILEQFSEFMAPLKLQRALTVSLEGCGGKVNAWYAGHSYKITYCYELIAELERTVAKSDMLPGFKREDAIVGGFVQILLHETAHAIFHIFEVPVFGREEDAADALSQYILLQLGQNTARRTLTGTAFIWRAFELEAQKQRNRSFEDFADEHGTHAQRFYNALCIAHGMDVVEGTKVFDDFVQRNLLPKSRIGHCPREYIHAKNSFRRLILPHVDEELMKKVKATEWLKSEDGTDILPPDRAAGGGGRGPLGSGPGGRGP